MRRPIYIILAIFLIFSMIGAITSFNVSAVSQNSLVRPMEYYLVDRVLNNADFATLAAWGINTAVVDFKVAPHSGTIAQWDSVVNAAAAAGIKIVIWPDGHQGSDVSGCRWETPFDKADINNGTDYIVNVKPILDHFGNNPNVIGIVTAHESVWIQNATTEAACNENIAGMTIIKTQIHDYINNTVHRNASYAPFKVWNYIDNIYNISNLSDYNAAIKAAQIEGIMDVAVIWQHCAGYPTYAGDGSACEGTGHYTALGGINYDRNTMIVPNGLEGEVEEVFIMQTFTSSGGYGGKFTLSELENYSGDFINTNALDGFGFYTWNAGWWPDLHSWTDLQPAVPYIYDTFIVSNGTKVPTNTLTNTSTATLTKTLTLTRTSTSTKTNTFTPTVTKTTTRTQTPTVTFTATATKTPTPTIAKNHAVWLPLVIYR
jgi:hypothetical protein